MPTSKYDALTALAKQKAAEFSTLQDECTKFATRFILELKQYLDSPEGAIICDEVGRDHRPQGSPGEIPGRLCYCEDGCWYFHLRFVFTYGHGLATIMTI